jgi:hypothetical protein
MVVVIVDNPINQLERLAENPPADVNENNCHRDSTQNNHKMSEQVECEAAIRVVKRH